MNIMENQSKLEYDATNENALKFYASNVATIFQEKKVALEFTLMKD